MPKRDSKNARQANSRSSRVHQFLDVHKLDARRLREIVPKGSVDVTVTSPPYFDLKDYGSKDQIGYGQNYEAYLADIGKVFEGVYECTKETGTLWVIIDSFRRDGEVVPLPFDFSNVVRESGWKLQDVIIWGKDRTVPWAQKGQMRSLFEYILVFSKGSDFVFNVDRVRSHDTLKKWWVRYPERYNPFGKVPEAIWNFDIPVQGSWGNGYIRHFCPLPEDMIEQILQISTDENDVVLDPFAGSGAVLAKADAMRRRYVGFELNPKFIRMFRDFVKETGAEKRNEYDDKKSGRMGRDHFYKTIVDLRALKFARVFAAKVRSKRRARLTRIYVRKTSDKPTKANALICVEYVIWVVNASAIDRLSKFVEKVCRVPPLSKYGIEYKFKYVSQRARFVNTISESRLYSYSEKATHKFNTHQTVDALLDGHIDDLIVSGIRVSVDEKDYD